MYTPDLIKSMRKRSEIRRQIPTRKSVQEGQPDRIADLLEEAATQLEAYYDYWLDRQILGVEDKQSIMENRE